MSLLAMECDLINYFIKHVNIEDLFVLSITCKKFYNIIKQLALSQIKKRSYMFVSMTRLKWAWNLPYFPDVIDNRLYIFSIRAKNREALEWLYDIKQIRWDDNNIINIAARLGSIDIIEFMVLHNCQVSYSTANSSALGGQHLVLEHLINKYDCYLQNNIIDCIEHSGSIECLEIALKRGCRTDNMGGIAALTGKLYYLVYLNTHDLLHYGEYIKLKESNWSIKWGQKLAENTIRGGHLDCLKYLHSLNAFVWTCNICAIASMYGHIECLKYARQNGCPWDSRTRTLAFINLRHECYNYARQNGCPRS